MLPKNHQHGCGVPELRWSLGEDDETDLLSIKPQAAALAVWREVRILPDDCIILPITSTST